MKEKKMSIRISKEDLNIVHYKAEQAKLTLTEYVTQCAHVNLQELTEEYASLNKTLTELLDRKRWSA